MAKTISDLIKQLVDFIRESTVIVHYFSDIMAVISLNNSIFENSAVATVVIWLVVALISAVIAELLKSHLPTPLRIIFSIKDRLQISP